MENKEYMLIDGNPVEITARRTCWRLYARQA